MAQLGKITKVQLNGKPLTEADAFFAPIGKDLDARSITPTAFDSMSLKDNPNLVKEIQQEIASAQAKKAALEASKAKFISDAQASIATLKADSAGVTAEAKFSQVENGLAFLSNEFDPKIAELENYLKELAMFEAFAAKIGALPLTFLEEYQLPRSADKVERFGINIPHLKDQLGRDLAAISTKTDKKSSVSVSTAGTKKKVDTPLHLLHPLEVMLIRKAIEHASANNKDAIVVDIFERDKDGSGNIAYAKDGTPGTHSIILCLQGGKVSLIDPSNSEFSRHVAYNADIISDGTPLEILVPKSVVKIYSPAEKTPTGPNPDQPRDCINIAVLIADLINSTHVQVDVNDLFGIEGIRQVTNQVLPKEYKSEDHLFFPNKVVARIRQTIDTDVRSEIYKLLDLLHRLVRASEQFAGTQLDTLEENATGIFDTPCSPDDYRAAIADMQRLVGETGELFSQVVKSQI